MVKSIEVCLGHNCKEKGSEKLKQRLEEVCKGLGYDLVDRKCSNLCASGPIVSVVTDDGIDVYSGNKGIFLEDDKRLRAFFREYQSVTRIEGSCYEIQGKDCGLAVDIGTTMIKASLIDLYSGIKFGQVSTINKQRAYGPTVLDRWKYINRPKNRATNLKHLSDIVNAIYDKIVGFFIEKSKAKISKVVLSGNTAMTYFFLNKDPCLTLEEKPDYTSVKHMDNKILLPCIFEWVGGDIVAGMTYLGFDKFERNAMLIDLGTNGEVALSTKDKAILVASASAGPAFEGEGFRCGMTAMKGAIDKVNQGFSYKVIGGGKPLGLCGSGMLDLIAEMLANTVMDKDGKLIKRYKINEFGEKEFFLTEDISIRQAEIDYFKNSKATIFATIQTVLQEAGLSVNNLDIIYVAGGFGNLNIKKAQLIGLLPPFEKYLFMGNTSLEGAQACLREENLERARNIAMLSYPLVLTKSEIWFENYKAARFFPHTNVRMFDKVLEKYI